MTFDEIVNYCKSKKDAQEIYPFDEVTLAMSINYKMFALFDGKDMETVNLKHDPELIPGLIASFECIGPGFHMNKTHWITVNFAHADIKDTELLALIDRSYDLVKAGLPAFIRKSLDVYFEIIPFQSKAYQKSLQLRENILRKPLRMKLKQRELKGEEYDIHIGGFYNEKLIACCIISRVSDQEAKIRQVAVEEITQGWGIGTKLMTFAESQAQELGYKSIILHARESVIPWYESIGYQITGDPFIEVGIPHAKMIKSL
jgi:hypothetical protein